MKKYFQEKKLHCELLEPRQLLTTFYVDGPGGDGPGGSDISGSGLSANSAFATIQRAANIAGAGDTILIRGGTYREQVTQPRSGAGDLFPITYQAFNGEEVVVSGGDLVTGWTQHSGDIWTANVPWNANNNRDNNTLFVNGELKLIAREFAENDSLDINDWGQLESGLISQGATSITLSELQGDPFGKWIGAKIKFHVSDWAFSTRTVTSFDGATGTISFDEPIGQVFQKQTNGFFLFDTYEALDRPGEWYKDNGNTLYYHAEPGQDPNDLEIEFKSRGYGFDIRDKDSIRIDGITFRGVSIYANDNSDNNVYQNNVFYGYGKGPSNSFGRMYITGDDNIFRGNEVYQTFGGVLDLGGKNNQLVNNYMHDLGLFGTGTAVINSRGSEQLIAYNTVSRFSRGFAAGYSARSEYAYNLFEDGGRLTWDTGVFDADSPGGDSSGSIFHHNVFTNSGTRTLYAAFYGRNENTVIHHNLIYDFFGGSAGNQSHLPPYTSIGTDFRLGYHNTIIGAEPAGKNAEEDLLSGVQVKYNNNLQLSLNKIRAFGVDARGNHDYVPNDFVDFNNKDFRLAAGSGAIDTGIVIPGINDGTLGSTAFTGSAPDAGALEFGESMWQFGHDFVTPPTPDYSWVAIPGTNLFANPQFLEGLADWSVVSGAPTAQNFNSWNLKEHSLTGTPNTNSVEFSPGDGISHTFTGLQPNTTYTLGANVRVINEVITRADLYNAASGSVATGNYRGQNFVHGMTSGEWVRFDNVDFGDSYEFDQIEIIHGRAVHDGSLQDATVRIRLDSATGPVIGEFSSLIDQYFWFSDLDQLPNISGTHSLYVSVTGSNSANVAVSAIRLIKERPPERDKLSATITTPSSSSVTANFGRPAWEDEYEVLDFTTGPSDTIATVAFENNGRINTYLDRMFLVEGEVQVNRDIAQLYGDANQSSTFGVGVASLAIDDELTTITKTQNQPNSWWQLTLPQEVLLGEIELVNQDDDNFGDLSNFSVSVWHGDPDSGGSKVWEKDYFSQGSVGRGDTFRISGNEIADDGQTRLASALGTVVRIHLNGLNNNGNGNLSLADVNVVLSSEAPAVENIARKGVAQQSSNHYHDWRLADFATDGNIDNFSHTTHESSPWWQIELAEPTSIDQFVALNSGRDAWYTISVWATDPHNGGSPLWSQLRYIGVDEIETINGWETASGNRLDSFSNARFVRLDRSGTGFAVFDEIQIWSDSQSIDGVSPTTVNLNATNYRYDFGTQSSPVESGYVAITPQTFGDISWTTPVQALDRGASAGNVDRDFIHLTGDGSTLRHRIANGTWEVTLRMGDNNVARDNMTVRAEGELINDDIDAAAGTFASVGRSGTSDHSFIVTVTDGYLDLEFHDNGGNADWVVNSLQINQTAGTADNDLSLEIDEVTGEAYLWNRTASTISLEGYSILDPNDSLSVGTWQSLDDTNYDGGSWFEANPTAGVLSELNPFSATELASGESIYIGTIANPIVSPNLRLLYFTVGQVDASPGFVNYTSFASVPGDFNADTFVDALDLIQWQGDFGANSDSDADGDSDSDGADFLAWQRNYSSSPALAAATIDSLEVSQASTNTASPENIDGSLQVINVPTDLTDEVTVEVAIDGSPATLELSRYSIRSDNFRLLVQEEDGSFTEIEAEPETTYRGRVAENLDLIVNAIFIDGKLQASIFDDFTGELLWRIEPAEGNLEDRYRIGPPVIETFDFGNDALMAHDHDGDGIPDHAPEDHGQSGGGGHGPGCNCPACCGQLANSDQPAIAAMRLSDVVAASSLGTGSSATDESPVAPSQANATVLNAVSVKQAEIAFDVSYRALRNRYGMPANPTQSQIDAATNAALNQINTFLSGTIEQRLNTIWLRDALVEHRLGTVVFRTSPGPYVPVEDAIIAEINDGDDDVPNTPGTNADMLNEFRNIWNSGVHGNTHDLAHLIIGSGGGGLAWVGTVGETLRYSQADGGSANAWFGFARHEVGHTWGLGHSHGGVEFFQQGSDGGPSGDRYGVMWGPNHGALTPLEQQRVVQERDEPSTILDDIGAFTDHNVRPYAALDTFSLAGEGTFMLDVLANDFDANNDAIFISGVGDRFSQTFTYASGSVVSIGHGLGDRGQDVMLYTPAPGITSETIFYRNNDGTLDNFGQVNVTVESELANLGAYQFDFGPNTAGTYTGTDTPRFVGNTFTTWNSVTRNDPDVNTVLDAEGNASSVTLRVRETNDGGTFNFAAAGLGLEDRTATNYTGIYGTQLMTDLLFTRNNDDLGIQVNGLPSGEYAIFAMLREPDASTRTYSVDIGVGTGDTASHGDFGLGNTTTLPADDPPQWVIYQNFYTETVSVGSGDSVFVLIDSTDSDFVSLQGLQIVRLTSPLHLELDATSGRAAIHNVSSEAFEIDGYAITSPANALLPSTWISLDDQNAGGNTWLEFLATTGALVEGNPTDTLSIAPGERLLLGSVHDTNNPLEIDFSYTSPDLNGAVFAPVFLDSFANPADFDWDQDVDPVDLGIWQTAYGQTSAADTDSDGDSDGNDFLTWQRNYNSTSAAPTALSSSSSAADAVYNSIGADIARPNSVTEADLAHIYDLFQRQQLTGDSRGNRILLDAISPELVESRDVALPHSKGRHQNQLSSDTTKQGSQHKQHPDDLDELFKELGTIDNSQFSRVTFPQI